MHSERSISVCLVIILILASFSLTTFHAEASEEEYHLILTSNDGGSIIQPDVDEKGAVYEEYSEDESVVIEAEPDDNYEFLRWTGDDETIERSRSNMTTITIEEDTTITAEFEKENYELSIDTDGEGEVKRPGEDDFEYKYNETVMIEADPDDNHQFKYWTGDIENIEDSNSELTKIRMKDDYDITAEFEDDSNELSIDVDGEGEVIRPGEGDFEYEKGEEIIIKAEAHENREFERWTGDTEGIENSSSELTTITIDDDYDITAEFEKERHELSIDIDGEGEVIRPEGEISSHEHGDEIILEVEPDEGYDFSGWTGDTDTIDDPDSDLSSIEMTDDHDITAEFESENIELEMKWIIIAILAIGLIGLMIKTKRSSEQNSEEKDEPKEGICENCEEIIPIESKECPECGAPLRPPDLPELKKGGSIERNVSR